MNLYDQQTSNRRRTWLIMCAFVAVVALIGLGFDSYVLGLSGEFVPVGTMIALAVGSSSALVSYYEGSRVVLGASGAVPLAQVAATAGDDLRLRLQQFDNIVDEMAIASGLSRPEAYVVPDADPNAFATGRGPGHASIAVTQGLLETLNREELQGVVAHEMSHIRNLDVRLMTIVAALVGAIALLSDWARRAMWYGRPQRRNRDRDGTSGIAGILFLAVWLLAIALAPLVSRLLATMVSRRREYLADASAAELTRNPLGLAKALEKIEAGAAPTVSIHQGSAHLCIADPTGRQANLREGFWADLFATHPPMPRRIAALKAMAFER